MAQRVVRYALLAVILSWYIFATRDIWPPILASFLLAFLLHPVILRIEKQRVPRIAAIAGIYALGLATLVLAVVYLVPVTIAQARYLGDTVASHVNTVGTPAQIAEWAHEKFHLPLSVTSKIPDAASQAALWMAERLKWLSMSLLAWAPQLIWVVIIPILAFYFLADFESILLTVLRVVPLRYRSQAALLSADASGVFSSYLRSLALLCVIDMVITAIALSILRVPNAMLLGLVAGCLYVVPYLGAVLSTVLVAIASFLTCTPSYSAGHTALVVLVMVLIHQLFLDQIVAPRFLGGNVGLHPILSIIAMLSGERLAGMVGMILAVPAAACIQIVVKRYLAADWTPDPLAAPGASAPPWMNGEAPVEPEPAEATPEELTSASAAADDPSAGSRPYPI